MAQQGHLQPASEDPSRIGERGPPQRPGGQTSSGDHLEDPDTELAHQTHSFLGHKSVQGRVLRSGQEAHTKASLESKTSRPETPSIPHGLESD